MTGLMLTQATQIVVGRLTGKEPSVAGPEADELRAGLEMWNRMMLNSAGVPIPEGMDAVGEKMKGVT